MIRRVSGDTLTLNPSQWKDDPFFTPHTPVPRAQDSMSPDTTSNNLKGFSPLTGPVSNLYTTLAPFRPIAVASIKRAIGRFCLEIPEQVMNASQRGISIPPLKIPTYLHKNYWKSSPEILEKVVKPGIYGAAAKGAQTFFKLGTMQHLKENNYNNSLLNFLYPILGTSIAESLVKLPLELGRFYKMGSTQPLDLPSLSKSVKLSFWTVLPWNITWALCSESDKYVKTNFPEFHSPTLNSIIAGISTSAISNKASSLLTEQQLGKSQSSALSTNLPTRLFGPGWAWRVAIMSGPTSLAFYALSKR